MSRTVADELTRTPAVLIVDLSEVSRIYVDTIDALASAAAMAGESDIAFCLVDGGGDGLHDAVAAADLADLFEIYPSVTEARDSFS
jgi:anti-sigma B factor antagonist